MSRALLRRFEREIAKLKPNKGFGKGWRLGVWGSRYPVVELDEDKHDVIMPWETEVLIKQSETKGLGEDD
jgi:hypothetical protein